MSDPLCDVDGVVPLATQCIRLALAASHYKSDGCPNMAKPRI
jgi:hypothetical protein